ncbi:MAG: RsmD family RNA methyltransferase [Acidobacteriota bacterium]
MSAARLRIIAGHLGGRRIQASEVSRPTQERVREALFSSWSSLVPGGVFADLFCGSGAMGLEALSRGAERAFFVDADVGSLETARTNARGLGVEEHCVFLRSLLPRQWQRVATKLESATLVFADPPYDFADYESLAEGMSELPGVESMAIEHSARSRWRSSWQGATIKSYGESALTLRALAG